MYFLWSDANTSKPLSELLYAVGAWSSNVSALTLLTLTNHDALNETAHEIGMKQTYLFANPYELPYWPPQPGLDSSQEDIDAAMAYVVDSYEEEGWVNITTPYDMATYQLGLINGTVVSPWVSEQIVDILLDNAIRDRLPAYLWDIPVATSPAIWSEPSMTPEFSPRFRHRARLRPIPSSPRRSPRDRVLARSV